MLASKLVPFVVLVAACNSAVVTVERVSSGAVERDPEFVPDLGSDGHYVTVPAYPFANCVDTLLYDQLVNDLYRAVLYSAKIDELSDHEMAQVAYLSEVEDYLRHPAQQGSGVAPLAAFSASIGRLLTSDSWDSRSAKSLDAIAAQLDALAATNAEAKAIITRLKKQTVFAERLAAAHDFAKRIQDIRESLTDAQLSDLRRKIDSNPERTGYISAERLDELVDLATSGRFDERDVHKLHFNFAGRPAAEQKELRDAIAHFARIADGFGSEPCASSARYRNFFGFQLGETSWVDRGKDAQMETLEKLAMEFDVAKPPKWPEARFSFLHFSDVQIREPGAKLGGSRLSHELRNIESSFEQDYEQEQYAMFVYNGIVTTAIAEWCVFNPTDDRCKSYQLRDNTSVNRVAPSLMVNTGDSADMGLQSEFDTFTTYTNKLPVPWYQAMGNHDVLAFGNLKLSSRDAPDRPQDDACNGWGTIPCTCTNLNTLVREEVGRTPDNRGRADDAVPDKGFTALPMLLKRICILHAITSDWFVMDPDKQRGGNPVSSFVLSHCATWHPKPGDTTPPPKQFADCVVPTDTPDPTKPAPPAAPVYAARASAGMPMDRCAVLPAGADASSSVLHGFDLGPDFKLPLDPARRDLGYYCFQMGNVGDGKDDPRRIWGVVLNTNTDGGAYGVFPRAEQEWLTKVLPTETNCASKPAADEATKGARIGCRDLVLVFAHHPVYGLYYQEQRLALTSLLTSSPNVVGFFIGHHHRSGLRMIRPLVKTGGHATWEVMGPSVIDYPQSAREITLNTSGDLGYFDVITFSPHGHGEAAAKIAAAGAGAVRDKCRNDHSHKLCPDGDGRIRLPARDVTFPRLFFRMPGAPRTRVSSTLLVE